MDTYRLLKRDNSAYADESGRSLFTLDEAHALMDLDNTLAITPGFHVPLTTGQANPGQDQE